MTQCLISLYFFFTKIPQVKIRTSEISAWKATVETRPILPLIDFRSFLFFKNFLKHERRDGPGSAIDDPLFVLFIPWFQRGQAGHQRRSTRNLSKLVQTYQSPNALSVKMSSHIRQNEVSAFARIHPICNNSQVNQVLLVK
jgi:hypothetical protein